MVMHDIVIVDDDPSVRRSLTRLLGSFGFTARSFASGQEYLESLEKSCIGPDCVVLDIRMQPMDGLDVQRQMASMGRAIPIVLSRRRRTPRQKRRREPEAPTRSCVSR